MGKWGKRVTDADNFDLAASTEWQAFLGVIRANPDEDTPRLVAADWLQEHNHPRKAIIRTQYALKDEKNFAERIKLGIQEARELRMLRRTNQFRHAIYERGFATRLWGNGLAIWNDIKKGVMDLEPVIQLEIHVLNYDKLLEQTEMQFIKNLHMNFGRPSFDGMISNHLNAMNRSLYLGRLEKIEIYTGGSQPEALYGALRLAEWARLPSLKEISFENTEGRDYNATQTFTSALIERTRSCIAENSRIPFPNLQIISSDLYPRDNDLRPEYFALRAMATKENLEIEDHELNPPIPKAPPRRGRR